MHRYLARRDDGGFRAVLSCQRQTQARAKYHRGDGGGADEGAKRLREFRLKLDGRKRNKCQPESARGERRPLVQTQGGKPPFHAARAARGSLHLVAGELQVGPHVRVARCELLRLAIRPTRVNPGRFEQRIAELK